MANFLTGVAKGFIESANQAYYDKKKSEYEDTLRKREMSDWRVQQNELLGFEETQRKQIAVETLATNTTERERVQAENRAFFEGAGYTPDQVNWFTNGNWTAKDVQELMINDAQWDEDSRGFVSKNIYDQRERLKSLSNMARFNGWGGDSPWFQFLQESVIKGNTAANVLEKFRPKETTGNDGQKTFVPELIPESTETKTNQLEGLDSWTSSLLEQQLYSFVTKGRSDLSGYTIIQTPGPNGEMISQFATANPRAQEWADAVRMAATTAFSLKQLNNIPTNIIYETNEAMRKVSASEAFGPFDEYVEGKAEQQQKLVNDMLQLPPEELQALPDLEAKLEAMEQGGYADAVAQIRAKLPVSVPVEQPVPPLYDPAKAAEVQAKITLESSGAKLKPDEALALSDESFVKWYQAMSMIDRASVMTNYLHENPEDLTKYLAIVDRITKLIQ